MEFALYISTVVLSGILMCIIYVLNKKVIKVENEIKQVWNSTEGKKWDL